MPSRAQYRSAMALLPGIWRKRGTSGIRTAPSTYVGVATGADAQRTIVSTDLVNMGLSSGRSDDRRSFYGGGYAYVPSTSDQMQVAESGYTGTATASTVTDQAANSSKVGYIRGDQLLSGVLAAGVAFEIWGPAPVEADDRMQGLHQYIARALRAIERPKRVSITGNGTSRISLGSTHPWLTSSYQVVGVWDGSQAIPTPYPGGGRIEIDGDARTLVLNGLASTTGTVLVDALLPAFNWIKVGSTWAVSSVGLVNETDEALPPEDDVAAVAGFFLYDDLASEQDARGEVGTWARLRDRFMDRVAPLLAFPEEPDRPRDPYGNYPGYGFGTWGSSQYGGYARSGSGSWGGWP